jgi:hypothetical protein
MTFGSCVALGFFRNRATEKRYFLGHLHGPLTKKVTEDLTIFCEEEFKFVEFEKE